MQNQESTLGSRPQKKWRVSGSDGLNLPKSYRTVFEEVVEARKSLLSKDSSNINPPHGYTFVPYGEPELTQRCKDISRSERAIVYRVSTNKAKDRGLRVQTSQVGHHFATPIVERAARFCGIGISSSGRLVLNHNALDGGVSRNQQLGLRISDTEEYKKNPREVQRKLDHDAERYMLEIYSAIPRNDVQDIIRHAFDITRERVGSSAELPLSRRVHLATLSHIRHKYTNYDRELGIYPYTVVRQRAEAPSLAKLREWLGDDAGGELEEVLREVVVVDDSDDAELLDDDDVVAIDPPPSQAFAGEVQVLDYDGDRPYQYLDEQVATPRGLGYDQRRLRAQQRRGLVRRTAPDGPEQYIELDQQPASRPSLIYRDVQDRHAPMAEEDVPLHSIEAEDDLRAQNHVNHDEHLAYEPLVGGQHQRVYRTTRANGNHMINVEDDDLEVVEIVRRPRRHQNHNVYNFEEGRPVFVSYGPRPSEHYSDADDMYPYHEVHGSRAAVQRRYLSHEDDTWHYEPSRRVVAANDRDYRPANQEVQYHRGADGHLYEQRNHVAESTVRQPDGEAYMDEETDEISVYRRPPRQSNVYEDNQGRTVHLNEAGQRVVLIPIDD